MSRVLLELVGDVAHVRLNRPEKLNALDHALVAELSRALDGADRDDSVRAVVLGGEGRAFCVGADLDAVRGGGSGDDREWVEGMMGLYERMRSAHKPIVGAVHGYALGAGLGLAAVCDVLVSADNASFGAPEVLHGLVAGLVLVYLREVVGFRAALDLVLTGRRVDGEEAAALGLATVVAPAAQVDERAIALASRFAQASPAALRLTKQLFYETAGLSHAQQLAAGRDAVLAGRGSPDALEGAAAFKERRAPCWVAS